MMHRSKPPQKYSRGSATANYPNRTNSAGACESIWVSQPIQSPPLLNEPRNKEETQFYVTFNSVSQQHFDYSNSDALKSANCYPKNEQHNSHRTVMLKKMTMLEHLAGLQLTFYETITEQFLNLPNMEKGLTLYNRFRESVLTKMPNAQIKLYGSFAFACCLNESPVIDVDVHCDKILPHITLKELLNILPNLGSYENIRFMTDNDQCYIYLAISKTQFLLRITSNYIRGIRISEIIQLYTKFDSRVIPLLRLFRYFAWLSALDQPDFGTLHPIVYNIMVIYFLQQIQPPVLPCLHEYIFGVDNAIITPSDIQHEEFIFICNDYIDKWKTENESSVEMLFLQLLSCYGSRFDNARIFVSIQTRMPILRDKRRTLQKLYCVDPTSCNRNLAYTMNIDSIFTYFRRTLKKGLNYFCQQHADNVAPSSIIEKIHQSYRCLFSLLLNSMKDKTQLTQDTLRIEYKKTFNDKTNPLPEAKIILTNTTSFMSKDESDEDEDLREEQSWDDIETYSDGDEDQNNNKSTVSHEDSLSDQTTATRDDVKTAKDTVTVENPTNSIFEQPIRFENLVEHLNENQKQIARQEYQQLVNEFNEKLRQMISRFQVSAVPQLPSSKSPPLQSIIRDINPESPKMENSRNSTIKKRSESLQLDEIISTNTLSFLKSILSKNFDYASHEFRTEDLRADEGLPTVCTICRRYNHTQFDCPETYLPEVKPLSQIDKRWSQVLSSLCQKMAAEIEATEEEMNKSKMVINDLEKEFKTKYSTCRVCPYGSLYNGFALKQSDIDVCVLLEMNEKKSTGQVLEHLAEAMSSNPNVFKDIMVVQSARVPIIRSTHIPSNIEVDISLNNTLPLENTRLLKTYSAIDQRVRELVLMIKTLVKTCNIGDASRGTLSSYAYTLMVIHFLQQIQPPVLPVLQQLTDSQTQTTRNNRLCDNWDVYFYDDLSQLKRVWKAYNQNKLPSGILWVEFFRYYTEIFDYDNNVVTIRQCEVLSRLEKGWFHQTIAIEDPFLLTHNLADKLSKRTWANIYRVFVNAGKHLCTPQINRNTDINTLDMKSIQKQLFNTAQLCSGNVNQRNKSMRYYHEKRRQNTTKKKPTTNEM